MKSDIDEVSLQGIEFWSNVSDEEMDLSIEATEATEAGRVPTRTSRFYAKGALQFLVPVLVQKLTKQVCVFHVLIYIFSFCVMLPSLIFPLLTLTKCQKKCDSLHERRSSA